MTTVQKQAGDIGNDAPARSLNGQNIGSVALRLGALALIDGFAIWLLYRLLADGNFFFALTMAVITVGINVFYLRDDLYPYRWFTPGLALMVLLVAYPTIYTFYVAFTNYADGNLLTRPQALRVLLQRTYSPEDAISYDWTAYRNEAGETILWLVDENDNVRIGQVGQPLVAPDESDFSLDAASTDAPEAIGDYERISPFVAASDPTLSELVFGEAPTTVQIPRNAGQARQLEPLYDYDESSGVLIDNQTGLEYRAVDGTFTAEDGTTIVPGYFVVVGLDNFQRLFSTDLFGGGELVVVFIWTFIHAFSAVFITFWVGLGLAIVIDHELVPAKKILRSMLLIPYAVPAFISVLVWRGLLEPNFGVVNDMIEVITFGAVDFIPWRSSVWGARIAILLIQMWLGFPYMLLICSGALQGIPQDMYEAADVDGAGPLVKFWNLTLPLLLVAVGPLLIASFAFNFNNFTVIQLYRDGGPPISTTSVAGYTDILITYTYKVAFASGRGADYGFATAITIVIFVLLTIITIFNFRLTKPLEEISENV